MRIDGLLRYRCTWFTHTGQRSTTSLSCRSRRPCKMDTLRFIPRSTLEPRKCTSIDGDDLDRDSHPKGTVVPHAIRSHSFFSARRSRRRNRTASQRATNQTWEWDTQEGTATLYLAQTSDVVLSAFTKFFSRRTGKVALACYAVKTSHCSVRAPGPPT